MSNITGNEKAKKAAELLIQKVGTVSPDKLKTVTGIVGMSKNTKCTDCFDISTFRISFEKMLSKEEYEVIKPYVQEYELDKPQNLVRFIVALQVGAFETINAGFSELKAENLGSLLSQLYSIKEKMLFADNEDRVWDLFSQANDIKKALETKIKGYAVPLIEYDTAKFPKSISTALHKKDDLLGNVKLASIAMEAYFLSLTILVDISLLSKKYNYDDTVNGAYKFLEELAESDIIALYQAYDEKRDNSIWFQRSLHDRLKTIKKETDTLSDCANEKEIDYQNGVIF